ncbi:hypothetical protein HZ992_06655 [Rhizobacter sp. AJA081-3]|uniref:hypothetical protein n=1 Tax=Rhizobacter sp. AJA081-3 TaxID=2753607 RepID=UPI001ADEF368|nr:hypothetical protein [Rhizobacter sp. AJA081-3]QTN24656.1 hypothetical protein HZ992_06655 [Rhizobacter sp. AJA081-3]
MTTTTTQADSRSTAQWLVVGAQLIAAALGAVFSYDFGMRISGLPLALLLAANGAFFGTIMVGYVADLAKLARDRLEQGSPRS